MNTQTLAGPATDKTRARILYVHHGMGIGGAPISLANLVASLDRSHFEPIVLMRQSPAVDLMTAVGAQVIYADKFPTYRHTTAGGYWAVDPRSASQWLNANRSDPVWERRFAALAPAIVHLNSITLLPLCRPARASGARVVVSVRETVLEGSCGRRRRWMADYLTQYCDAVIHISEYDRRQLGARSPVVEVVPNWVDLARFDRTLSGQPVRDELGLSAAQQLVVTFGGATPIKGTLDFVRAAQLLQGHEQVVFGILGMGPPAAPLSAPKRLAKAALRLDTRERIYEFVERHGLRERVRFLGARTDVPAVLAACELLVFPATRPHQARPVFEAGAMAKPVIATDFACIREEVTPGENGLLVPAADPAALAQAMADLLRQPDKTRTMGEINYQLAVQRHNRRVNAPKIQAVYAQLL